jgi:hypothetical protein
VNGLVTPTFTWAAFWHGTRSGATPGFEYPSAEAAVRTAANLRKVDRGSFEPRPMNSDTVSGTIGQRRRKVAGVR